MANKIIPKKSVISGRVPTTADLGLGEISINHADRIIYARRPDTGGVQSIAASPVHNHVLTDITDLGDLVLVADWNEVINKPTEFVNTYSEPTYTNGVLTALTKWSDNSKAVLVENKTFSYTNGNLTQVVVTDGNGAITLTKTLTYAGDNLASVTKDFA